MDKIPDFMAPFANGGGPTPPLPEGGDRRLLRVIHLISGLETGGAEITLYRLLSKMNRDVFECQVISMTGQGALGQKIQSLGVPVRSLDMRRGVPNPRALLTLVRWLKQYKPHILQTWMYHADLMGILASWLVRKLSVIWNVRASRMDMSRYRFLSAWTIKACSWLSGHPQVVLTNSHSGREHHARIGYHPRQWATIPNGIDTETYFPDPEARLRIREELGLAGDTILIGLIARYDPKKDHQTFLHSARNLHARIPTIHFLLCGKGVTSDNALIASMITSLELTEVTHLLGERRDISRILAALDIVTSSSAFGEGFPNVVAEAMACGVPAVVTDVGDSARIVGDTGIVVPPQDPQAIVDAWSHLIELGRKGREKLGRKARERICDLYSLDKMVLEYEQLYREVYHNSNE